MKAIVPLFLALSAFVLSASNQLLAGSATWNLNPTSGDWTTANNWTPTTVPNGASDTATFVASNTPAISIPTAVEVQGIIFNPGASSFTITPMQSLGLIISGTGITNNSATVQTFVTTASGSEVFFENNASAGKSTLLSNTGSATASLPGGEIVFAGNSTANQSTCVTNGGTVNSALGADTIFNDSATADQGTFIVNGGAVTGASGGSMMFLLSSTAGNGTFTINGSPVAGAFGGIVRFNETSTAGDATFTTTGTSVGGSSFGAILFLDSATAGNAAISNKASAVSGSTGGALYFYGTSDATNAVIVNDGASVSGALGGTTIFSDSSTAGSAILTANGGISDGGGSTIFFFSNSTGGLARVQLFDNASLNIGVHESPGVTIGSIEGTGSVFLGTNNLAIGSNNLSISFSGLIQDSGSLTKLGTGTLTLSGANTYTGGSSVIAGVLRVGNKTGSATGTGTVNVNTDTLGGKGTIGGATIIGTGSGTGAILAPGVGSNQPITLTIKGGLTFKSDSTYICNLDTRKAKADRVLANGVTVQAGAQFAFGATGNRRLRRGAVFTAISNTAALPISGTFANLPDGSTFTVGRNNYQVSYEGGDGNDLTLTVVP